MSVKAEAGKNHPKRILIVITKATWGGAQRYVYDLAEALHRDGEHVVVAHGDSGLLADMLDTLGIPRVQIPGLTRDVSGGDVAAFTALRRLVAVFAPHVIHSNSSKAGALAALTGRIYRTPRIIFTAHGWAYNEKRPWWQKALIAYVHWLTILLSHTTICVSSAVRTDARWMPLVQSRLRVIHNGITATTPLSQRDARNAIAPQLATNHATSQWIGTIAELHPTKNIDVLIDAFAEIASDHDAVLVIIGEGSERAHLEARITHHNLHDRIVLAGFLPAAAQYLSALDVFVLPSHSEALGYVILEAGLAQLPVVASRVGGIPDIILDGESGLLVPPGDRPLLATSISSLLSNTSLRTALGTNLSERVHTAFSVDRMVATTRTTYNT